MIRSRFFRSHLPPVVMDIPLRSLAWNGPNVDQPIDVTDALEDGRVSSTPHPDDEIEQPKGYSIKCTLKADRTEFAETLQNALMAVDPITVTLQLDGVDAPITGLPVGVTKVPYPGDQNEAELSVKPEGHDKLHPYF